ncbi:MAG: T9SS type A sorting domain-containing protein, partial [Bacteroidia bacterium]
PSENWLGSIYDNDADPGKSDWILSGNRVIDNNCEIALSDQRVSFQGDFLDPYSNFETLLSGSWAPYRLGAITPAPTVTNVCREAGVRYSGPPGSMPVLSELAGTDIIITSDKSKWSRCVVFESGPVKTLNQGQREAYMMRAHASVDKDGRTVAQGGISDVNNPEAADYIWGQGMGWFPGYAVNTETGERLNIAFAENSSLAAENGADMRWNPTATVKTNLGDLRWGGMHTIYVFGHNGDAVYSASFATPDLRNQRSDIDLYDMGKSCCRIMISAAAATERKEVFRDAMWVNIPVLNPGHTLFETDVRVSLRVTKPYAGYITSSAPENNNFPLYGFSIDKRNLGCNLYDQEAITFPNPFRDEFTVMFDNRENLLYTFRLYNLQGQLVHETTTQKDKLLVSGAGMESGMYLWSLSYENETRYTGKIINY